MSTENAWKIKLLKIMELLRREFNEEHPIPGIEIMERLEDQGISGSERSITRDMFKKKQIRFLMKQEPAEGRSAAIHPVSSVCSVTRRRRLLLSLMIA